MKQCRDLCYLAARARRKNQDFGIWPLCHTQLACLSYSRTSKIEAEVRQNFWMVRFHWSARIAKARKLLMTSSSKTKRSLFLSSHGCHFLNIWLQFYASTFFSDSNVEYINLAMCLLSYPSCLCTFARVSFFFRRSAPKQRFWDSVFQRPAVTPRRQGRLKQRRGLRESTL